MLLTVALGFAFSLLPSTQIEYQNGALIKGNKQFAGWTELEILHTVLGWSPLVVFRFLAHSADGALRSIHLVPKPWSSSVSIDEKQIILKHWMDVTSAFIIYRCLQQNARSATCQNISNTPVRGRGV